MISYDTEMVILIDVSKELAGTLWRKIKIMIIIFQYLCSEEGDSKVPCKIWGFHGGDYEESSLLGCGTV
jgi:hypothetical protein